MKTRTIVTAEIRRPAAELDPVVYAVVRVTDLSAAVAARAALSLVSGLGEGCEIVVPSPRGITAEFGILNSAAFRKADPDAFKDFRDEGLAELSAEPSGDLLLGGTCRAGEVRLVVLNGGWRVEAETRNGETVSSAVIPWL